MGREGLWVEQPITQAIDIACWRGDEEFEIYPEGARDKSLLISPQQSEYRFLIPNHRYLFKHSFRRYPEQFWTEIIAYRLGCLLEIPVPPAFVAFNSHKEVCGSLIEWFLQYPDQPGERFNPGGDILSGVINSFDRKKGEKHNFISIERYFTVLGKVGLIDPGWLEYWCDMLLFDALIGNTDRHQDNWGLLWSLRNNMPFVRIAPVFNNGTSLGYEILESKMENFTNPDRVQTYIKKGRHHLRWQLNDSQQIQHIELILKLLEQYPILKNRVQSKLSLFQLEQLQAMMSLYTRFQITIPLSVERADFICKLISARHQAIRMAINL
jgi:hypothetical protein